MAEPEQFEVAGRLAGDELGDGPPVVLLHGITATRNQVVHGSNFLAREGLQMIKYDARGHGDSEPTPDYGWPQNVEDLELVLADRVGDRPYLLAGHSMGSHTAVAHALGVDDRIAGLVVIGPVYEGPVTSSEDRAEHRRRWDALADGLEHDGVDGFLRALDEQGLDPKWRDAVLRFTRERMLLHKHPKAVAAAIRAITSTAPYGSLEELETIEIPALVVASHDVADPGHPYAVAKTYAELLPSSRLISEAEGESPLAWQGGTLAREILAFSREPAVAERLAA
jgi:pimeloyl-ACP methyl ester carboxylesterase